MVVNRLCDPASKLGVLRLLDTVALPRGFGFDAGLPEHQHLLRAMDVLDDHADAIGERLAFLMRPLIDQELSVVFYDLTTVRVHGEAMVDGDVREFGLSKGATACVIAAVGVHHQRARPVLEERMRIFIAAPNAEVIGHPGLSLEGAPGVGPHVGLLGFAPAR